MIPTIDHEKDRPSGKVSGQDGMGGDLSRKRRLFRTYEDNKRDELKEQREARQYYHAKQWTESELQELKRRGQPPIFSNRTRKKIDFMVGIESRQRRDPRAYGRNPGDEDAADVATASLRFVTEKERWDELANRVAADGYINGIGIVWCGITRDRRGNLEVTLKPVQVDRFFYDSRSSEADFSDARFMGMHLWYDVEDAKSRWPDKADQLSNMMDGGGSGETTWIVEHDRDQQWGDQENRRLRVVEFWEKVAIPYGEGEEGWQYCFFCGDIELESGWSPYVNEDDIPDCPYIAWTAYVDETGIRYGLVRDMKPLQDEINHRRSKFLHILNSNKVHMRDGLVDDIEEFRKQMAKPDGVIEHHGTWGQDIGVIDQSVDMQGQADLLNLTQAEFENTGPNPGLVGQGAGVANASGRALLAQRDSGMTELSMVIDRLRDFKLRTYRAIWARIKQAWTTERYIRITENEDAPQYLGLNIQEYDEWGNPSIVNNVGEIDVDIIMEEGPDMITMQDELLERLSQLGETALTPLGPIMIELSGAPNKDKLIKMLEDAQGIGEPSEEELEAQDEEDEQISRGRDAEIANVEADAALKRAKAKEVIHKLRAQVQHLQSQTDLNKAKTQGEIIDAQASEINTDLSLESRQFERSNPTLAHFTSRKPRGA